MDSYDNDWLFLDDDLFFVYVFLLDDEEPDADIAIMRADDVD